MAEFCKKHCKEMGIDWKKHPEWCCESNEGVCEKCGYDYVGGKTK